MDVVQSPVQSAEEQKASAPVSGPESVTGMVY